MEGQTETSRERKAGRVKGGLSAEIKEREQVLLNINKRNKRKLKLK